MCFLNINCRLSCMGRAAVMLLYRRVILTLLWILLLSTTFTFHIRIIVKR